MVCVRAIDEIKDEKVRLYMDRSTPHGEPEYITKLRREAYINGMNAGSLLFIAPAMAQAAACEGTNYRTSTAGQDITPGTLPIYYLLKHKLAKLLKQYG